MLVIVGAIIVVVGVIGGFVMEGGPIATLMQWVEFIIIGGAALGSLVISAPISLLKRVIASALATLKGDPYGPKEYQNLLMTIYSLSNVARRNGLISLEGHVEDPSKSEIFSQNTFLLNNHHAMAFLCDTLRMLLSGGVPPHEMESLLDADLEGHHKASAQVSGQIQKIGDALPGVGIVAAVLGIVITMGAIDGPPSEIGHKVAAALVGTFLGILLSYGFVQPIASNLENLSASESAYYECMKAGILAIAKGYPPQIVVEFSRRVVPGEVRPSFKEMEETMKAARAGK